MRAIKEVEAADLMINWKIGERKRLGEDRDMMLRGLVTATR